MLCTTHTTFSEYVQSSALTCQPLGLVPAPLSQIFGPKEDEALDIERARAALDAVVKDVNAYEAAAGRPAKSADEVAMGFVAVANEAMCRPIRALTQMKARMLQV